MLDTAHGSPVSRLGLGIRRECATALRVASTRGPAGIAQAIGDRLRLRSRVRRWWYRDREWVGQLVQLRGNRVQLDGCTFDVSHPQISNLLRARLLRGRYERSERALLDQWLDPNAPVVEFGGGIGIVATLVNRRLRDPRQHVVVEANPSLIPVLERQKAANHAGFTVVHAAVDYSGQPTTSLYIGDEFISAQVGGSSGTAVEVPSITMKALMERYKWTGATLVCDIEGIETQLVELEGPLLRDHCRTLMIEIHPEFRSAAECQAVFTRLEALGFERVASVRKVHAFRQRGAAAAAAN